MPSCFSRREGTLLWKTFTKESAAGIASSTITAATFFLKQCELHGTSPASGEGILRPKIPSQYVVTHNTSVSYFELFSLKLERVMAYAWIQHTKCVSLQTSRCKHRVSTNRNEFDGLFLAPKLMECCDVFGLSNVWYVEKRFDPLEEPSARIIVITMDREKSLSRLLRSLSEADYGGDHVDLDIWIDKAADRGIHTGVLGVANAFQWKQGTKVVHSRLENAGLYQQWVYTWNITDDTTEFAVIFEDDLEVSPAFYQWLKLVRSSYAEDTGVGAFTLQRGTLRPRQIRGVASGALRVPEEHTVYLYRLLGTWGFAPQRDVLVEFRQWFEEKMRRGEKPYVSNLITTDWYKKQEKDGFAPTMWSQWWIKFADERDYFTMYANMPGNTTLCANWREKGMHYSKTAPSRDFPVFQGNMDNLSWPETPIRLDWDGRTIRSS